MADIAELAGVSVSTVSRSLAGSSLIPQIMREKIEAIAKANGYVVNQAARMLRLQTTRTISIVLPAGAQTGQKIADPFLLEMTDVVSQAVFDQGYDILLTKVDASHPGWLNDLVRSNRVDGVLLLAQNDMHDLMDEMAARSLPVVVWGQKRPRQSYCSVGVDNVLGGELATSHLIETGRRHIVFMGSLGVPEIDNRYEGYCRAMKRAKLKPRHVDCGFSHDSAVVSMQTLLESSAKFDAIFAASDVVAHGAKIAFTKHGGSVPDDCAFVGFDDVAMARHLTPPLTTVRQPLKDAAQIMVDLLLRRIEGEQTASIVLDPELVVRETA
ncbi:LacI family DNA-binding transcriptional regulator [Asticcacaulis benevestitus]|uniref:HTH lacI-type domain-containing protein n=1 Tax=Asticcacaulis benevestitus DSM 16100 = ATCC BAA-896 TaxID=1121022 RepID=V4RNJ7_9CAUL|nr:substrate-binding domain-containing protein [Asticcacaulis benevestitus]ESQ92813.1 hypothetical protein ABENE_06845 [Asticcacaulis benevestitus DSM 16100 = ATCC BAA-896]